MMLFMKTTSSSERDFDTPVSTTNDTCAGNSVPHITASSGQARREVPHVGGVIGLANLPVRVLLEGIGRTIKVGFGEMFAHQLQADG